MSSESILPEIDGLSSNNETLDESLTQLILDPEQNRQATTSLYLGIFSISPVLFIFQAWSFIPALMLCGFVLWKVWELRKENIRTIVLPVAVFVMVLLSVDSFFLYPDLDYQVRANTYEGTFLYSLITFVAVAGIFVLPVFATLAVIYGFKAKLHIFGIVAGSINLIGWLIFGVTALGYALLHTSGS